MGLWGKTRKFFLLVLRALMKMFMDDDEFENWLEVWDITSESILLYWLWQQSWQDLGKISLHMLHSMAVATCVQEVQLHAPKLKKKYKIYFQNIFGQFS